MGTHCSSGRERQGGIQPVARHHPRSENHFWILGYFHLAHGGTGGAPGALEPAPGRPGDAPFRAGQSERRLPPDGLRAVRQGGGLLRRRTPRKILNGQAPRRILAANVSRNFFSLGATTKLQYGCCGLLRKYSWW